MASDTLSQFRHELRTLLTHIIGYADILLEDTSSQGEEELHSLFRELRTTAQQLREPIFKLFSDSSREPITLDEQEATKRGIYGILYDTIALVQTAKRQCTSQEQKAFLPDIQKLLEAANGIAEIFEESLSNASYVDGLVTKTELEELESPTRLTGTILVVDDDPFNRELLARHLERQGHTVSQAADGASALAILAAGSFDLVLLDIMMPGMNGYQFLEKIKATPGLRDINVIVVSALEESGSIARCLRLGAEDYLPREFDPIILRARIESCLERKRLRAREELSLKAVAQTQKRLAEELRRAAEYVRSLLPRRVWWPDLRTDWVFLPSLDLGGDSFGYTRLANGSIALYLIDVSGHGIEAALLSISLLNRIQAQSEEDPALWDPARMLLNFNHSFRSEEQNNLYFSAWFGLWNPSSRELLYSSAGSPPAMLITADRGVRRLTTENPAIGVDADATYEEAEEFIPRESRLYLFSDGIFETSKPDKRILGLANFEEILRNSVQDPPSGHLTRIVESIRTLCDRRDFDDDVSLVGFYFDA